STSLTVRYWKAGRPASMVVTPSSRERPAFPRASMPLPEALRDATRLDTHRASMILRKVPMRLPGVRFMIDSLERILTRRLRNSLAVRTLRPETLQGCLVPCSPPGAGDRGYFNSHEV